MPGPQETSVEVLPTPVENESQPFDSIEGLPEDIPVLPENNGDLMTQDMNGVKSFMYSTDMDVPGVKEFFSELMMEDGWKLTNTTTAQASIMLFFEKDGRMALITITKDKDVVWISIMPDMSSMQ